MIAAVLFSAGCGYHTAGKASQLPTTVQTIAIPIFVNRTQTYRIENSFTSAVVQEFNTRTKYRVISDPREADAILNGTVLTTQVAPITYDSQTGHAETALVTVTLKVSLIDRNGRVLYDNPNYLFRDQYQISREVSSFFEEEGPALGRISRDMARTLVSNVLEAY